MALKYCKRFCVGMEGVVGSVDGAEDVCGEFAECGDVIVRNARVESFNDECDLFGEVVEVGELEDDMVEKWDCGIVLFLVVSFVGGDEEESVLESVQIGEHCFVDCVGCCVGCSW